MPPNPITPEVHALPQKTMRRMLGGVSIFSWSAYLISAVLWFWYGIQRRDRNIHLPCVGCITLDVAVIWGVIVYG